MEVSVISWPLASWYTDRIVEPEGAFTVDSSRDSEELTDPVHLSERRLMLKIDTHVLPILCVLYFLAFLDRYVL